ncbi:MAG: spermidine/putrescine transport system substrate-binding protein, partial [Gammaproteobacteria bacterium]
MKYMFKKSVAAIAMVAVSSTGYAAGELNLFNWGNYTSPELITKF